MRLFRYLMAAWLVVVGLAAISIGVFLVLRGGPYGALIPASILAVGSSAALLFLRKWASIESDENGLKLTFLFHTDRVAWNDIDSYRYPAIRRRLRADAGNVWTVLTYQRASDSQRPHLTAIGTLPRVIEDFLRVPDEWITVLDRHVPERNLTCGRNSGR